MSNKTTRKELEKEEWEKCPRCPLWRVKKAFIGLRENDSFCMVCSHVLHEKLSIRNSNGKVK